MSTTPVPAPPPPHNVFIRFIDKIGSFFIHAAPVIEEAAVAAEPLLALTPFGPEYNLVVNAIVGAQKTATASLSTGAALSGTQKMSLTIQAITPGLSAILASKGIKESTAVEQAIAEFAQNIYNLQTGPVAVPTLATPASPAPKTA